MAVAAALPACGADGNGDPAAAPGAAAETEPWDQFSMEGCDLVTDEEIGGALGEPVQRREEGGYFGCRWTTASHRIAVSAFATTTLPADTCTENQSSMPYGQTADGQLYLVDDLGDRALWGSSGELHVCTGRGLLVVIYETSPATMGPDDEKQVAIIVARHALGRLE
jgi:hypothetical protein